MATPIGEVYRYTLEGAERRPDDAAHAAGLGRAPALMRVPGVADVVSYGGLVKESPRRARSRRRWRRSASCSTTCSPRCRRRRPTPRGGYVERGTRDVRDPQPRHVQALDDIGKVRVGYHDGVPVQGQRRRHGHARATRRARASSRAAANEDAVEGIVLMRRGENPSVVLEALRKRIDELNEHSLPNGQLNVAADAEGQAGRRGRADQRRERPANRPPGRHATQGRAR